MTLNVILRARATRPQRPWRTLPRKSRSAGSPAPNGRDGADLANRLMSPGRSAGADRTGGYRPHRNQSADRPRAEIGGTDFPHRLSNEVFRYNAGRRARSRIADGKSDRSRAHPVRLTSSRPILGHLLDPKNFGALDRGTILIPDEFLAKSVIAPTPVGFVSWDLQPAFGLGAGRGDHPCSRSRMSSVRSKKARPRYRTSVGRGLRAQVNDVGCGGCIRPAASAVFISWRVGWRRSRRIRPSSRPRRHSSETRCGVATSSPHSVTAAADFSRGFPAVRSRAARRNWPGPNMRMAGARIAYEQRDNGPRTTRVFAPGPAPRGLLPDRQPFDADGDVFHQDALSGPARSLSIDSRLTNRV